MKTLQVQVKIHKRTFQLRAEKDKAPVCDKL